MIGDGGLLQAVLTTLMIGMAGIAVGIGVVIFEPNRHTMAWGVTGVAMGAMFLFVSVVILAAGTIFSAFG